MNLQHLAVGLAHAILHAGSGCQKIEVELPLQTLLDDLHMQQAQKADAESKAQSVTRLRVVDKRRVVELQLVECVAQVGILVAVDGIEPGEHHGLHFSVAGKRLRGTAF